jgi:hypothetical protein
MKVPEAVLERFNAVLCETTTNPGRTINEALTAALEQLREELEGQLDTQAQRFASERRGNYRDGVLTGLSRARSALNHILGERE